MYWHEILPKGKPVNKKTKQRKCGQKKERESHELLYKEIVKYCTGLVEMDSPLMSAPLQSKGRPTEL